MRKALLLALALAVFCPDRAYAATGFWAWLEELSGPGPFKGPGASVVVGCVADQVDPVHKRFLDCYSRTNPHIKQTFVVSIAWLRSGEGRRFKDLPATDADNQGRVTAFPVTALVMFRPTRALDVGFGAGFIRLRGKGVTSDTDFAFSKILLVPASASLSPLALNKDWAGRNWAYLVRLAVETSFVPQGFKGSDFKNSRTTFDSGPEFLTRVSINIDVGALLSK